MRAEPALTRLIPERLDAPGAACQGAPRARRRARRRALAWCAWGRIALLLIAALPLAAFRQQAPGQPVRVGVYENRPIVFSAEPGRYAGVAVEVLEEVAAREGWQLRWVHGTWEECLARLDAGTIDLLVGIAYSEPRARRFRFSRVPLISNWGTVYRNPQAEITSLLDLTDKRLAMVADDIHEGAISDLLAAFGVPFEAVEADDLHEVMRRVERGEVEAGVVNRLFSLLYADRYDVVATGIVFNPIEIHYAAPAATGGELLAAIDRHLESFKQNPQSVYHAALRRWLAEPVASGLPAWARWALGGTLAVLLAAALLTLSFRRQVRLRTAELVHKSRQLEHEVAERKLAQDQLNRLAFYDGLTGLPNRFLFRDRLRHALTAAAEEDSRVALLFVDVDRFKAINDSYGHTTGDELLRLLAERLERSLREGDTVCRLGGDEFTVILGRLTSEQEAAAVARRIVTSCVPPFELWRERVYATVSIGIALYPSDAIDADGLMRCADAAMYHVKQHGRNGYHFYTPELIDDVAERLTLEAELREALTGGELTLRYQPIFHLASGVAQGVEALLRLRHPTRGWLAPEDVIPVAEESRLILEIGDRVLAEACRELGELHRFGLAPLWLSVNVSSRQFAGKHLLQSVDRALAAGGLAGGQLQIELTESLFVDGGPASTRLLAELREREVRICVDDFGTGYSSLSYLQRLPLDSLKIDRSFIQDIPQDHRARRIASAIIAMARGLGLEVIAEGVETAEQLDFLRQQGCAYGQGFYLGRPMRAAELEGWLRSAPTPTPVLDLMAPPPATPAGPRS